MVATCLSAAWRAVRAQRRLVLTVWFWNAVLALAAGAGAWRWLGAAFDHAPDADRALERFSFGLLAELLQYDRFSPMLMLNGVVLGTLVAAALSNPVVSAGILEVLVARDERPVLHRFFRGAGHFYGRFLRLLLTGAAASLLAVVLVSALTGLVTRAIGESAWERTWLLAVALRAALLLAIVALGMAITDVARARVVRSALERRAMVREWLSAARFVFRHPVAIAGIYLTLAGVWVLFAAAGQALVLRIPATGWAGIVLLVLVQQAFMLVRAALRVARAAAGLECLALTGDPAEHVEERIAPTYSAEAPVNA